MALILPLFGLAAQELYWEEALDISGPGAYYPQMIQTDKGYFFSMWQEYKEGAAGRITTKGSFSDDGTNWSAPVILLEEKKFPR